MKVDGAVAGIILWVIGILGGAGFTASTLQDGNNAGLLVIGSTFAGMAVMGLVTVWRISNRQFGRMESEIETLREHHKECEARSMADRMRVAMLVTALQSAQVPIPDGVFKNLVASPETIDGWTHGADRT